MVKISSSFPTKTVSFASIPGSEIKISDGMSTADFEEAISTQDDGGIKIMLVSMTKMIADWNLEGDDGEKLKISIDNLRKIDILDLREAFEETRFAQRLNSVQKKT